MYCFSNLCCIKNGMSLALFGYLSPHFAEGIYPEVKHGKAVAMLLALVLLVPAATWAGGPVGTDEEDR